MKGDTCCRLEPAFLQLSMLCLLRTSPRLQQGEDWRPEPFFMGSTHCSLRSLSSFPNLWTKKGVYLIIKLEVQDRFKAKTILWVCIYTRMDTHVKTHTYICTCMQWVIWVMYTCLCLIWCTNICIFATVHVEAYEQKSSLLAFETNECVHPFCVAEHMAFK